VKRLFHLLAVILLVPASLAEARAQAAVHYDRGRREIGGLQLLQAYDDPTRFYYLPRFPRLALREDSTFEILVLKYVGADSSTSGGLFHALVEFTHPPERLQEAEDSLAKLVIGAEIVGPVPLQAATRDGADGVGSFQLVSATLAEGGGFARRLITSGAAPLAPGSKGAIAAVLNPEGATLLWNSLSGPTSDVSVAINAYYEAVFEAYNAQVSAEMSVVYEHLSTVLNRQQGYTRRQLRNVVDELQRDGALSVEVVDRTRGTEIDAAGMQGILDLVTEKLTELMFDPTSGWSTEPEREWAVEPNQLLGRQEEGFFAKVFGGGDTRYYTDDQWVMKDREDIRQNRFYLNLSQSGVVRVPVSTAGNLGGIFDALGNDPRYFRIVNMADPAFETRPVHFHVDQAYFDAFKDLLNYVSVDFRKLYPDGTSVDSSFEIGAAEIDSGASVREVSFPRLGLTTPDWPEYDYRVRWSLRDGRTLALPERSGRWLHTGDGAVTLRPPLERQEVLLDADRDVLTQRGVSRAVVEFASVLAGERRRFAPVILKADDSDPLRRVAVYHDPGAPVVYRVTWIVSGVAHAEELRELTSDYLFLAPPEP
jgi:hypothetical protein